MTDDLVKRLEDARQHKCCHPFPTLEGMHAQPRYAVWESELNTPLARIKELEGALRLHKAWADSEHRGPDYGGQSRDTHPDGEIIWRRWWDNQLDLCRRAEDATDAALLEKKP